MTLEQKIRQQYPAEAAELIIDEIKREGDLHLGDSESTSHLSSLFFWSNSKQGFDAWARYDESIAQNPKHPERAWQEVRHLFIPETQTKPNNMLDIKNEQSAKLLEGKAIRYLAANSKQKVGQDVPRFFKIKKVEEFGHNTKKEPFIVAAVTDLEFDSGHEEFKCLHLSRIEKFD